MARIILDTDDETFIVETTTLDNAEGVSPDGSVWRRMGSSPMWEDDAHVIARERGRTGGAHEWNA